MCSVVDTRGNKRIAVDSLDIVVSRDSDGRIGIVDIGDLTSIAKYDKTNETSLYVEYERRELKRIMKQVDISVNE
jgi:hypothetical protein